MTKKTAITAIVFQGALLVTMLTAAGGCGGERKNTDQGKPRIFVSIAPLEYFANRIAGDRITVNVLIGPGGNPHTYAPAPKQIVELNRGGLLLCAGSDFGRIISERLSWGEDKLRIVNLAADSHADDHHHHDEDPHVWMSPRIAKTLADGVCEELCTLDPTGAEEYRKNLAELNADLDALDAKLAEILAPVKGKTFFVFHPAFGHLAEAYGLKQQAVESQGKSPGPKDVGNLIAQAKTAGVKTVFVQPQFSGRAATVIAEAIGGKVVRLDPLSGDYVNNLHHIAEELKKALQP